MEAAWAGPAERASEADWAMSYVSKAYGPAIHSYPACPGVEQNSVNPLIAYVSKANGQAIYGYPAASPVTVAAYNLRYVDTAYGQAIFSYPGLGVPEGQVDILPVVPN
jgi:hypothetical protein